jgi:hypothetical protein
VFSDNSRTTFFRSPSTTSKIQSDPPLAPPCYYQVERTNPHASGNDHERLPQHPQLPAPRHPKRPQFPLLHRTPRARRQSTLLPKRLETPPNPPPPPDSSSSRNSPTPPRAATWSAPPASWNSRRTKDFPRIGFVFSLEFVEKYYSAPRGKSDARYAESGVFGESPRYSPPAPVLPHVGTSLPPPFTKLENIAISHPCIAIRVFAEIISSGFQTPPRYISGKSLALTIGSSPLQRRSLQLLLGAKRYRCDLLLSHQQRLAAGQLIRRRGIPNYRKTGLPACLRPEPQPPGFFSPTRKRYNNVLAL